MLGNRIRNCRAGLGLTQAQLAEQVGVGQTFVSQIELGEKFPSVAILIRLAFALGVGFDELLRPETARISDGISS